MAPACLAVFMATCLGNVRLVPSTETGCHGVAHSPSSPSLQHPLPPLGWTRHVLAPPTLVFSTTSTVLAPLGLTTLIPGQQDDQAGPGPGLGAGAGDGVLAVDVAARLSTQADVPRE